MSSAALPAANGSVKEVQAEKRKCRSRRCEAPLAGTKPGPGEGAVDAQLAVHREQVCSRLGEEPAASDGKVTKCRREWQPEARDHLIYRWVKFDGQTQAHTAADFGISQATVSRIIDRYERWQAHADPREGGRLDPAERLRAQRWLTYERNELIVASALRIANRMEGVTELSKSVRTKPQSEWYKEGTEIRSEEQSVDRHGVAARFLRLAFRVNMEQLKLVEQDVPPLPEPLTDEQLSDEEGRDAAVAEEFAAAEQRSESESMHAVHNLHNGESPNTSASAGAAESCVAEPKPAEFAAEACIGVPEAGSPGRIQSFRDEGTKPNGGLARRNPPGAS